MSLVFLYYFPLLFLLKTENVKTDMVLENSTLSRFHRPRTETKITALKRGGGSYPFSVISDFNAD